MNSFIYRNKRFLLKIKNKINSLTGLEIVKYPTPDLDRRIKLLQHHNIDVIIDIGANIGQYGSEMRNIGYKGRIISFEPTSEAFEKLSKTSKNDSNWEIHHSSLGERDGKTTINISKNSVSSSLLNSLPELTDSAPDASFVKKEEIDIKKLDTIFDSLNIHNKNIYLKIDTQGYESLVLDGGKESLKKISGIQLEMALISSYEGGITFQEMTAKLNGFGFNLVTVESGFYDKVTGKLMEVDGVFYK
ncbi:MAG: FkbM family methyltransferase [Flavobacterium sp.]|nr:FkbM family methyltransferase [Flavobacterium sp.]